MVAGQKCQYKTCSAVPNGNALHNWLPIPVNSWLRVRVSAV